MSCESTEYVMYVSFSSLLWQNRSEWTVCINFLVGKPLAGVRVFLRNIDVFTASNMGFQSGALPARGWCNKTRFCEKSHVMTYVEMMPISKLNDHACIIYE